MRVTDTGVGITVTRQGEAGAVRCGRDMQVPLTPKVSGKVVPELGGGSTMAALSSFASKCNSESFVSGQRLITKRQIIEGKGKNIPIKDFPFSVTPMALPGAGGICGNGSAPSPSGPGWRTRGLWGRKPRVGARRGEVDFSFEGARQRKGDSR